MLPNLFAQMPANPVSFVVMIWSLIVAQGFTILVNLALAVLIFFVGKWAARLVTQLCERLMRRWNIEETLLSFFSNIIFALLMTFVIIAAVHQLGVDTMSMAAVVGAAGLAVGLALQNSLGNFASGVMLILFKPFKVGDFIEAGGTSGIVEEIHIFSTRMRTGDNLQIVVPNSQISGGTITNYSTKPIRRIDLTVGCGYDDDLREVRRFLEELVRTDARILADPEPFIGVSELADSSVNFAFRPWVAGADYWNTRCDLLEKIKLGFDERGFSIPYPQRDVYVHQAAG